MSTESQEKSCYCDPVSKTSDCHQDWCTPFFAVFFTLHTILLFALIAFFLTVEFRTKNRSNLWRIILGCGILAQTAKVVRTGLLINVANRESMDVLLYTLYNTHVCLGSISFISLLFFWARLHHDLVKDNKTFGRLLPVYITIVVLFVFFYYLQVVALALNWNPTIPDVCTYGSGIVSFVMALAYIIYAFLLWQSVLKESGNRDNVFFKMYVSAFVCSVLIIVFDLFILGFNVNPAFDTTRDYLIKNSVYETLYLLLFLSLPSGFVVHYLQNNRFHFRMQKPVAEVKMKNSVQYEFE